MKTPGNTTVVQRQDFRFYPVVMCSQHPEGYLFLARKGRTVSFRTAVGARRYLLRTFGDAVVCPVHGK